MALDLLASRSLTRDRLASDSSPQACAMSHLHDLYRVRVSFEGGDDPAETARVLLDVFEHPVARAANARLVSADQGRVTIEFPEVSCEVPVAGADYVPSRPDEPEEAAGRAAIEALAASVDQPGALLPLVRAIVAVSAARSSIGLAPRQHISLEVEPSAPHRQEELRHT